MLKNEPLGIPNIIQVTGTEPLNHSLTIKLWPTVATYIESHGGADFIRKATLEKLRRIQDKALNQPVKCSKCANLIDGKDELYCRCTKQVGFLDRKLLNEVWVLRELQTSKS